MAVLGLGHIDDIAGLKTADIVTTFVPGLDCSVSNFIQST